MASDEYRRAKALFLSVLELPEHERAPALDAACAGDARLLENVRSLLAEDAAAAPSRPLVTSLSGADLVLPRRSLVEARLGPFVIREFLGEGGMGSVWAAEQDHPRRLVALKVLRSAIVSDEGLRRFRHEVELLGHLHHHGIAQVYHADTCMLDGQRVPYFAMELVRGARPLDEFARSTSLGPRDRIALLVRVCDAVHHGHLRGIIHRDLKPGNILVGEEGDPKIIDFGVARSTDSDLAVTTLDKDVGTLVGTLRYMSPEQCAADAVNIDCRSDVYSLGVVLYELICDRPPYDLDGLTLVRATRVICERPPVSPRAVRSAISRDLEAITCKALEKKAEHRYDSVAALGADLRRWMQGDFVEARRSGAWRKVGRWIGRHPVASTLGLCMLIASASLLSLYVGLARASRAPSRIALDPDGGRVTLYSHAGSVLKRWTGPARTNYPWHAALLSRPDAFGDGGVIALVTPGEVGGSECSGQLCLFDAEDPATPYWTSARAPPVLPDGQPERREARFNVTQMLAADLLPELPGDEIAACHVLVPYSQTCLRIYDLRGEIHFELWHDGATHGLAWLAGPSLLIVTGQYSEWRWDEIGYPMPNSSARYPAVVFALRIEDGYRRREFIIRENVVTEPRVAWYRWIGPVEQLAPCGDAALLFESVTGDWSQKICFQVKFGVYLNPVPSLHLVVSESGQEVSRFSDDNWKRWLLQGLVPRDSDLRLLDVSELPAPQRKPEAIDPPKDE